jgi:hypothetical protein
VNRRLIETIQANFESKGTEELLEIWKANDRAEYSDEAFAAIEEILTKRMQEVPAQDAPKTHEQEEKPEVKGKLRWWIVRVPAVIVFLLLNVVVGAGITQLFIGETLVGGIVLVISGLPAVGAALLERV